MILRRVLGGAIAGTVLALAGTAAVEPKICLSVLVGGVMGAANLWLWVRIVHLLVANAAGQVVDTGAALVQGFLKLFVLFGVIGLASYLSVNLMGLAVGFGATLIGASVAWMGQKA